MPRSISRTCASFSRQRGSARGLAHQGMAGRVEIHRHLEGEGAAWRHKPHQAGQQAVLIRPAIAGWRWRRSRHRAHRPSRSRDRPAARSPARRWRGPRPAWLGNCPSPSSRASGQRAARSAVELPGPQPRSMTRAGCSAGTRASSSAAGRVRWSRKAEIESQDSRTWARLLGPKVAGSGLEIYIALRPAPLVDRRGAEP